MATGEITTRAVGSSQIETCQIKNTLIVGSPASSGKSPQARNDKQSQSVPRTDKKRFAEQLRLINRHHVLAVQSDVAGFVHRVICGRTFLSVKEELGHKKYGKWLSQHVRHICRRTVQRYQLAAETWLQVCEQIAIYVGQNATAVSQLPPDKAMALVPQPQASAMIIGARGKAQATPQESHKSGLAEWLTPNAVVREIVAFQRTIDLDACASFEMPEHVPALRHYTKQDDGLLSANPWRGRVFANPGHLGPIGPWVKRGVAEVEAGTVEEAMLLLPAITDAEWAADIQPMVRGFLRERQLVEKPGKAGAGKLSVPLMLVLISKRPRFDAFAECIGKIADIFVPHRF